MVISIKNKILNKGNFSFQEKLEISNLFENIFNKINLIVPINITKNNLLEIFSKSVKVKLKKLKIDEKINILKSTKYLFIFVFLKDSDDMVNSYNEIRSRINFNNENRFETLKRSFKNEGIYLEDELDYIRKKVFNILKKNYKSAKVNLYMIDRQIDKIGKDFLIGQEGLSSLTRLEVLWKKLMAK